MKPYKNPQKYQWTCPFPHCRKVFYAGGQGHLSAKACAHLRNVHDRPEDAGYIYKHGKAMSGYPSIPKKAKCPHCGGELEETHPQMDYDYDCTKCGRGWEIQEDGSWKSRFATVVNTYTKKDVERAQKFTW